MLPAKENSIVSSDINAKGEILRKPDLPAKGDIVRKAASVVKEGAASSTIEQRVIDIVCDNLGVNKEQVTRQTSFIEDIGADSLDIVELVMELEEEFEITIPDDQAEQIKTVGEAIDYIEREQAKK
jgi:acyl carrier protein